MKWEEGYLISYGKFNENLKDYELVMELQAYVRFEE